MTWRGAIKFIRTRFTPGRSSCWTMPRGRSIPRSGWTPRRSAREMEKLFTPDRPADDRERFFRKEVRQASAPAEPSSIARMAICRSAGDARCWAWRALGVYRKPCPANDNDLEAMRRIDALFTAGHSSARGASPRRSASRVKLIHRTGLGGRRRARHRGAEAAHQQTRAGAQDGRFVLCGGAGGGAGPIRQAGDLRTPTRAANSPARPSPAC